MKECKACKQTKPLTDFYTVPTFINNGPTRRPSARCKKCVSSYNSVYVKKALAIKKESDIL